ncbi:DeoR/GlpR family DNA-binding transcription regulator [Streptomyces sp. NPDC058274]|uniref:DeoR/GlpR family DNA-binding transcription regulator n=1 Tax=Streptomyces sp. NPDC058274 TaxID=3346416 RepID=UPI0036E47557
MTSTVHGVPAERRRQLILRALRSGGPAAVSDLCEQLGVSPATVRRDLVKLEEDGLLTRVHGGAVVDEGDQPFAEVAEMHVPEKDAIAARAASLVEDGQSVLLDIGTTAFRPARQLHADRLFLGTSGVRPGGQVMDTTVVEVPVKRAMIEAGERVVLLADRAKFPGTGMAKVCGPDELDAVVTNAPVDAVTRSSLEEAGVQVVVAGEPGKAGAA